VDPLTVTMRHNPNNRSKTLPSTASPHSKERRDSDRTECACTATNKETTLQKHRGDKNTNQRLQTKKKWQANNI